VIEIASDALAVDRARLAPDSRLLEDLGLDSLEIVEFLLSIEEAFDVAVTDEAAQRMFTDETPATLRSVARLVRQQWHTRAPLREAPQSALPAVESVPFTQLGGRPVAGDRRDDPLYEPIGPNRDGFAQFRRRTDGMRCVLVPGAEACIGSDDPEALTDQRPAGTVKQLNTIPRRPGVVGRSGRWSLDVRLLIRTRYPVRRRAGVGPCYIHPSVCIGQVKS